MSLDPQSSVVLTKGLLCGLAAALVQSLSYVFSRVFVTRRGNTSVLLFATSHVLMGAAGLVLAPLLYGPDVPPFRTYVWPMAGAALYYLLAQAALFQSLRVTEASRVAPMLGVKILILAVITTLFLHTAVTPMQWAGVALCVAAAFVLNYSGGSIPPGAVAWILLCCVGYCFSDLSIKAMMDRLDTVAEVRRPAFAVSMTYVMCGVVGAAVLAARGTRVSRRQWVQAAPVAATWLVAMVLLFACFKYIGVVRGNIVQSTRGIISILIGSLLARRGLVHLEQRVGAGVLGRRLAAATLMCVAIALFVLESGVNSRPGSAAPAGTPPGAAAPRPATSGPPR